MPSRRLTLNTASRLREQMEYLDLQITSADIYGNRDLEQRLRRERGEIRKQLGQFDQERRQV